jgi:rhamnogalacturonan endolyase
MKKLLTLSARIILIFASCCFFCFNSSFAQQWNIIGNENQVSSVASPYTAITVLGNIPYVVYTEGTVAKVKRRNPNSGAWEQIGGNLAANATYTKIYADKNNKLYVTYVDGSNSNKLAVVTFNTVTQAWEPLVAGNPYLSTGTVTHSISQFGSTPRSGLAFDNNNIPYVTFSERATTGFAYVKRFVSGAWQTLGGGTVSADTAIANNIVLDDNNVPYVVYVKQSNLTSTSGTLKVYRFNVATNAWENVSPPNPVAGGSSTSGATTAARHSCIEMDNNYNPVVSFFNASNSNKSTLIRYNKSTGSWSYIGTTSSRDVTYNSLFRDNGGNLYNTFVDCMSSTCSSTARVFKLSSGTTAFTEVKNASVSSGIDAPVSNLNVAVGSDTSKPFVVYTKTNSSNVTTPIVQVFGQPVITNAVTNITSISATSGGVIPSDIGSTVTERGIVYSINLNPTTADTKIIDASTGGGSYTSNISGLSPATTYHVRAYAISNSGTQYGSDIAFITSAPDPNSVLVQDNGTTVVLSNGSVKATINKSNTTVTSLIYNGVEMISGGYNGGQIYWSWNKPNYQQPSGCTYTLTVDPRTNNFTYAEIKMHMTWDGTASTAAMDVDVYYSLTKTASGIYASSTVSHPANYPALPGGEWRMASYPNPRFDWLSVDSLRNKTIASGYDWSNATDVSGAPPEVKLLTTGVYKNNYECKYDYSADFGAIEVWGWSSTADNVGLWMTTPSKEYYPGGPMKRELMCHSTPVLLNMFGGTHYGMGDQGNVAAGETWQKTFGPFLIYCNNVPAGTANAPIALWKDAQAQAKKEQAAWPYSWYTNPGYLQETNRGTVKGRLVIEEANSSTANMWIGLAPQQAGTTNVADFQHWSKDYQFWVKTDANGNFTIPHVLPGTYNFYAFGTGAAQQLSLANYVTVTAGSTTDLSDVKWTPARVAPTVWEIGTPDRTAMEFKHGADWWTSNVYPDPDWGKFMDYSREFPNDVNFTIGQSNIATDWNFVMPYNKSVQSTSPKWNVNFKLPVAPVAGSNASVYVALAENFSAALILNVNGINVTSPSTGIIPGSASDAMIRKGIHGAFGEARFNFPSSYLKAGDNQITFSLRITGGASSGEVMYDYLRLEANIPSCTMPVFVTSPADTTVSTRTTGCDTTVNYVDSVLGYPTPSLAYTYTGATTGSGDGTGSGSVFNKGITTVTITATNSCGTAKYSFNVTVNDSTNPVITAPGDIKTGTNNNCSAANLDLGKPIVSDNCSTTDNLVITNDAPTKFPQGTTTVTWTVKDESGNTQTATQQVTVVDDVKPTITAPEDVQAGTNNGCSATSVVLGTPAVSDNCSDADHLTVTNDAPNEFPQGTTTVTWTVKDAAGNTTTATQQVTVVDDVKPTITAPANVQNGTNNGCTATSVALGTPTVSDNCSDANHLTVTNDAPNEFPQGTTTVTWTVKDAAGNTSTATQQVTVVDDVKPSITAPANVEGGTNNGCSATGVALGIPTVTDNCSDADHLTVTNDAPTVFPQGTTTVTWTVKDAAGNTSTATQQVTVADDVKPTITTPAAVTVNADNGNCSASNVSLGTPVTADNCSVASVTNNAPLFYPVGTTVVTWTVKDAAGNTSTGTQTVTVIDDQKPTVTLVANPQVTLSGGSYTLREGDVILSKTDNCGIASVNVPSIRFTCNNIGINSVSLSVTDIHNNMFTATVNVNVIGAIPSPGITVSRTNTTYTGAGTDKTIFIGYGTQSLNLTASNTTSSPANTAYTWSPSGSLNTSAGNSTTYTPGATQVGTNVITALATNEYGCTKAATVQIVVVDARCGDKILVCEKPDAKNPQAQENCVSIDAVPARLTNGATLGHCTNMITAATTTSGMVDKTEVVQPSIKVNVYPNRTSGQFNVQLNHYKASKATVMIIGINGLVVTQKEIGLLGGVQTIKFNMSNEAQGLYLIKVISDDGIRTEKLVIQK